MRNQLNPEMAAGDIAISIRNLSKTYRLFKHPGDRIKQFFSLGIKKHHGEFTALRNISLDVKKGEAVGIIGRNGSGKSTLLQLICGILRPTSGTVQVNGRISALLELGAGFNPEFTGRENIYFQGALMGFTKEQMAERFDDIAAFADIGEFIDQPVRTYSSGMFVRLAFAVSVYVEPEILVVDEALSVGDAQFQAKCFEKFRTFKEEGVTILFVTHSLDLVTTHCERAILLDNGVLAISGNPNEAINAYRRLLTTPHPHTAPSPIAAGKSYESKWAALFNINPGEVRYGSKETEIVEAGLFTSENEATQLVHSGDVCKIRIRLFCRCVNSNPSMSFVIKDTKGTSLIGTNSIIENSPLEPIISGQIFICTFQLPMFLNPGQYLLSIGSQSLATDGSFLAHDIRSDYLTFEVIGTPRYGIFSPPIQIDFEEEYSNHVTF